MMIEMKPWCRLVNDRMFVRGIRMGELAAKIGFTREYTSSVVHGRHYSPKAMKLISEALDVPYEVAPLPPD